MMAIIRGMVSVMTTKFSDDLRHALEQEGGTPLHLVDAATNVNYVLMRADQYEKVKAVFESGGDLDPRDAYPLVDRLMQDDDALDPSLASYQRIPKKTQ